MTDLLTTHREMLERFRATMNLVGPGPVDEHYVDADEALSVLSEPRGQWVDLGTGAGFPGIPFAARFPEAAIDLVDSRRKRCVFVDEVLGRSDLTGHAPRRVICQRVESLRDGAYDGVLSRAFAPPSMVLDIADRLLKSGGMVLLLLQADSETPVDERFIEVTHHPYTVPGRGPRQAVVCRKV